MLRRILQKISVIRRQPRLLPIREAEREEEAGSVCPDLLRHQFLVSEQRFRALLESLPRVAVQGYDRNRRVIYWNDASTRLYGYTPEEAQGRLLEDLIIPAPLRERVIQAHRDWIEQGNEIPADEIELRHSSGELVPVFSHHVMLNEYTNEPLMFCVDVDLSVQKRAHRELDFANRYDRLTHLLNRHSLEEQLNLALAECRRQASSLVLAHLDVDHFVEINEALGYDQGDLLLVDLANRLNRDRRATDILSRVSGDEFIIAFPGIHDLDDIPRLVRKVEDVMRAPFVLEERRCKLSACLGIAIFPDNGETAGELIRNADVAKNRAKLSGKGQVVYFNQQLHDELLHQHRLSERLERAVEVGELCLYYQPQVSAISGRIEHLEALLRWIPEEGLPVSPAEFIPLAERSELIHRIGDWVLEEACWQRAEWRASGVVLGRIDINFSGRQIKRSGVFDHFEACVERYGLGPRDIGIELTENVLIEADDGTLAGLRRLHDRGFRIAIDDFGTGYSSLSYLKLFPVTSLKIDRAFVRDAPKQPEDRAIMEATVFIGHRLGLEVVAEGVENREQLELAREMRCDMVQGFYFFRPMAAPGIERLLADTVRDSRDLSG
ncbi:putative bifunctional diguanylate cyclase/phosphodiesterase [Halomonas sp.]|uniref:putative bifunctional diguanylate cyclase/phosphodiesterase n=1 Tax=Halomonas sp. TaxID=1486246 RepID=UPI00384AF576